MTGGGAGKERVKHGRCGMMEALPGCFVTARAWNCSDWREAGAAGVATADCPQPGQGLNGRRHPVRHAEPPSSDLTPSHRCTHRSLKYSNKTVGIAFR